jgi:hypothetical protein
MTRNIPVKVLVTASEAELIKARASEAGLSVSSYIYSLIFPVAQPTNNVNDLSSEVSEMKVTYHECFDTIITRLEAQNDRIHRFERFMWSQTKENNQ